MAGSRVTEMTLFALTIATSSYGYVQFSEQSRQTTERLARIYDLLLFKSFVLELNTMNDKVLETIENKVRSMTFVEALHGYEQYEHACVK